MNQLTSFFQSPIWRLWMGVALFLLALLLFDYRLALLAIGVGLIAWHYDGAPVHLNTPQNNNL